MSGSGVCDARRHEMKCSWLSEPLSNEVKSLNDSLYGVPLVRCAYHLFIHNERLHPEDSGLYHLIISIWNKDTPLND